MLKQPYLLYALTGRPGVLNCDMFYMVGLVQLKIYGKFSGVIYEDYIPMGNLQMSWYIALKHL